MVTVKITVRRNGNNCLTRNRHSLAIFLETQAIDQSIIRKVR